MYHLVARFTRFKICEDMHFLACHFFTQMSKQAKRLESDSGGLAAGEENLVLRKVEKDILWKRHVCVSFHMYNSLVGIWQCEILMIILCI